MKTSLFWIKKDDAACDQHHQIWLKCEPVLLQIIRKTTLVDASFLRVSLNFDTLALNFKNHLKFSTLVDFQAIDFQILDSKIIDFEFLNLTILVL